MSQVPLAYRIAMIIFVVEAFIMGALNVIGVDFHETTGTFIDATLLTAVAGPAIYFWIIRPYIEARNIAEKSLRTSEARFRDFTLSSSDWHWEMGPDLTFTYLSERFEQAAGVSVNAVLGKPRQHIGQSDPSDQNWSRHMDDLQAHRPFKDFRYQIRRDDQRELYVSVNGVPVFNDDQEFLGYRGTTSDITEITLSELALSHEVTIRKEAEQSLRQELEGNRLLIAMIEASPIGMTISDISGDESAIIYCNKAFIDNTGYSIEQIYGKDIFFIFGSGTDPKNWETLENAIREKHPVSLEMLSYRSDGTTFWNDISVFPIVSPAKDVTNIVTIQADISREVEMRDEKEKMLMRAMETSKIESLGTLAGGIAHEINTPIQYIGDNVSFLKNEVENFFKLLDCYEGLYEKAHTEHAFADDVEKVARRRQEMDMEFLREEVPLAISQSLDGVEKVANIVKAVKEFSHPGSSQMQPVSINHLIDNVTTITQNQWKYVADLHTDLAANLPSVECNANELNQIFVNLIVNACHAIEDTKDGEMGSIAISSKILGAGIEVRIRDDGSGIAQADQERIFDMFFTTKPPGQGTGQGLAICHNIIKNHHGEITVNSKPGEGTSFMITLPFVQPKNTGNVT